ncbi:MAG: hypothetical protein DRJ66_02070 [Thermoprotei archaeon]|nr:MAG: hypothetical protein DRJ66_02070 [Thermoprotei archaeon]
MGRFKYIMLILLIGALIGLMAIYFVEMHKRSISKGSGVQNMSMKEETKVEVTHAVIKVIIHDENPYHVFEPGNRFKVEVTLQLISGDPPSEIYCQWKDFMGKPLSDLIPLELNKTNIIWSPKNVTIGYYGLVFLPSYVKFLPNREIGFAVLPKRKISPPDPQSPFGIVHMEVEDPYIDATWIKTLTDYQFSTPSNWRKLMDYRRKYGRIEIPLIIGEPWECDNTKPISKEQLQRLHDYLFKLFSADPNVPVWELGLEENLKLRAHRDGWKYFWHNLKEKLKVAQEAKNKVNPNIKIAYQIAELDYRALKEFFESGAADYVDILSLHPYKWPYFETPEVWHDLFIKEVRKIMRTYGKEIPIWYTEVGAPQNDAGVPRMYSNGKPVKALTRREEVDYLIKIHVLALRAGVEKIIWYNYKDRGDNPTDVEDHFGLRDYWGFPKPAYVAYANMVNILKGKRYNCTIEIKGVYALRFSGENEDCIVVWAFPENATISLLDLGIQDLSKIRIVNAVGTPLPVRERIELTLDPIYIVISKK